MMDGALRPRQSEIGRLGPFTIHCCRATAGRDSKQQTALRGLVGMADLCRLSDGWQLLPMSHEFACIRYSSVLYFGCITQCSQASVDYRRWRLFAGDDRMDLPRLTASFPPLHMSTRTMKSTRGIAGTCALR